MRRSWLVLGCALLLAVVAVEGRCCKEDEECRCEKRHRCVEECCEKRCCCIDEEGCKKKHSHVEEEEEEADENKDPHVGKMHTKKRPPLLEEAGLGSSEFYEERAKEERKILMGEAAQSSRAVPLYRKEQAIAHFNRRSQGTYYKHLEDGHLEFKKAIGVMVYVKMLLTKTNCTKPEEEEGAGVDYSRAYLEKEGCQLLPKLEQERDNCTFSIFIDMRTEKKAVVNQECTMISGIKKLPSFLRGVSF